MKTPVWLTRAVIDAVHQELLARFGGLAGVRDEGLLQSALARPEQLHAYGDPTLFDLAAAYAYGIVKNHPFIDGNKRLGFMAAYIFLGANHLDVTAPEEEVVVQTLALAASECSEAEYAAWRETACASTK
ncbi:MAG: type II toxin-antitoxin system death-on-curing family toxin [Kiritimatiellia bacterium]|jgi:death-on-curing protein|nr:type II toxin-antitoxin system death-on-curing family toxin [Kiritimatiellia bacterium]MDP6847808.1 type II toxin-antitoxin system death-on-curing family toxin [Kiritimatiellia bacterium]